MDTAVLWCNGSMDKMLNGSCDVHRLIPYGDILFQSGTASIRSPINQEQQHGRIILWREVGGDIDTLLHIVIPLNREALN
ncbi:uncharacterized [Tachysurus ichikawai]